MVNANGALPVAEVTAIVTREFQSKLVVLSGGASTGVGAVGAALADKFGFVLLSLPALIDAEVALGTVTGQRLEKMIKVGGKGKGVGMCPPGQTVCLRWLSLVGMHSKGWDKSARAYCPVGVRDRWTWY